MKLWKVIRHCLGARWRTMRCAEHSLAFSAFREDMACLSARPGRLKRAGFVPGFTPLSSSSSSKLSGRAAAWPEQTQPIAAQMPANQTNERMKQQRNEQTQKQKEGTHQRTNTQAHKHTNMPTHQQAHIRSTAERRQHTNKRTYAATQKDALTETQAQTQTIDTSKKGHNYMRKGPNTQARQETCNKRNKKAISQDKRQPNKHTKHIETRNTAHIPPRLEMWQFAVSSQAWNVISTGKCQRISTFNGFHALVRSLQAGLPFSLVFASQKKDFVPRKLA